MKKSDLIAVEDLRISFKNGNDLREVVHGISFSISENEILGIVGESGSGKSVTSLAMMNLLSAKSTKTTGSVFYKDKNLLTLSEKESRKIRGKEIAMIFQEPMNALNPSLRCGIQVTEILKHHLDISGPAARKQVLKIFEQVKLPDPEKIFNSYPHQISGGQMQRVMISIAIACKPRLLIADEPTTALDVTVQKEIISLLKSIQRETGMAMVFISHDLNLVSEIADRVLVMYRGKIAEQGTTHQIFKNPQASYTRALLRARPSLKVRLQRLPTIASLTDRSFVSQEITAAHRAAKHKQIYRQEPLLEVFNLKKYYYQKAGFFSRAQPVKAVSDVSFSVYEGETLGLVGESGCGKSTLGRAILQLEPVTSGSILYRGQELTALSKPALRALRKEIQIIFQDPYSSLNPRMTIGQAIAEPLRVHDKGSSKPDRKNQVLELLDQVGLEPEFYNRYPHQLSGGQRQRAGIARTIALRPKLIICDESVSALDISVQAQVLNLLNDLKNDFGFTYIFISHDLAVVKFMADQLLVMNAGTIVERGDADEVYARPRSPYTQKLISAIPKGI